MFRKFLAVILSLMVLTGAFYGCSSNGNESSASSASESSAAGSDVQSTGNEEVKVYWLSNRIADGAVFAAAKEIYDQYHAENPNFVLEAENIHDKTSYMQKLKTLIASKNVPDLFDIDTDPYCEQLIRDGILANVGEYLDEEGLKDLIHKAALTYQELPETGELYTFPLAYEIEMFWYNTEIFEENQISKPDSLDEFLQICETLKQNGVTPLSVGGQDRWTILRYLAMVPFRLEGNDYIFEARTGNRSFTEPTGIAGMEFLEKVGPYFNEGFTTTDYTTALNMFLDKKVAMIHMGTWELNTFMSSDLYKENKLDYFTLPMMDGATTAANEYVCNSGIGLAFNAETFDNTKGYLKYLVENYGEIYTKKGMLSPVKYDIPEELEKTLDPLYLRAKADIDAYGEQPLKPWDAVIDPDTYTFLGEGAAMIATGDMTPEEYAAQLDESVASAASTYFPE